MPPAAVSSAGSPWASANRLTRQPNDFSSATSGRSAVGVAGEIEAVVGGQLAVAVGHERRLRRPHLLAQRQEARIAGARRRERIAFEVELDAAGAGERRQRVDVVGADVARIGTRVHGDAVRAGVEAGLRGPHHVGLAAAAGIAQHRDLVDVDAEDGHRISQR